MPPLIHFNITRSLIPPAISHHPPPRTISPGSSRACHLEMTLSRWLSQEGPHPCCLELMLSSWPLPVPPPSLVCHHSIVLSRPPCAVSPALHHLAHLALSCPPGTVSSPCSRAGPHPCPCPHHPLHTPTRMLMQSPTLHRLARPTPSHPPHAILSPCS